MDSSVATTTSTLYPVINFMSSMANMFEGSAMATVSVAPTLATGIIRYFFAISAGMSFSTDGAIV